MLPKQYFGYQKVMIEKSRKVITSLFNLMMCKLDIPCNRKSMINFVRMSKCMNFLFMSQVFGSQKLVFSSAEL